jgi:hypothetical protein
MADEGKGDRITLEELMVSTLAMTDALAKLLIAKGIITDEEIKRSSARGRIFLIIDGYRKLYEREGRQ